MGLLSMKDVVAIEQTCHHFLKRCKLDSVTCKVVQISIWCSCNMPECIDNMICCDNMKCKTWFHRKCLTLDSEANEWQCPSCQQYNE